MYRHLTNIKKSSRPIVEQAAVESGQKVVWSDKPDSRMDYSSDKDQYGSLWSSVLDLSDFWRAFNRIKDTESVQ